MILLPSFRTWTKPIPAGLVQTPASMQVSVTVHSIAGRRSVTLDGSVCETWGICSASQAAALIKLPGGLNYAQGAAANCCSDSGVWSVVICADSDISSDAAGAAGNSFGPLAIHVPARSGV